MLYSGAMVLRIVAFKLALFSALGACLPAHAWVIALYGAANYADRYAHEGGPRFVPSARQFELLYDQVDAYIREHGSEGEVYLNDLRARDAQYAADRLRTHLDAKGHPGVRIYLLPGDYFCIALPRVDHAFLSHPYQAFFDDGGAKALDRIAASAKQGLVLTTYYRGEFAMATRTLANSQVSELGPGPDYIYPSGHVVAEGEFDGFGTNQGTRRYLLTCATRLRAKTASEGRRVTESASAKPRHPSTPSPERHRD